MKKVMLLAAVCLLAMSTTACQSSGEKLCVKTHDCAVQFCESVGIAVDTCVTIADKAEDTCLENAQKADEERKKMDSDCVDAYEDYASCMIDGFSCKNGVPDMNAKCDSKYKKMQEKCTGAK